jgi:hypothetical protein
VSICNWNLVKTFKLCKVLTLILVKGNSILIPVLSKGQRYSAWLESIWLQSNLKHPWMMHLTKFLDAYSVNYTRFKIEHVCNCRKIWTYTHLVWRHLKWMLAFSPFL